jgi:hypothetical protein
VVSQQKFKKKMQKENDSTVVVAKRRRRKTSSKRLECAICLEKMKQPDFFSLSSCSHRFCRFCCKKSILVAMEENLSSSSPTLDMFPRCMNGWCAEHFTAEDVEKLLDDREMERFRLAGLQRQALEREDNVEPVVELQPLTFEAFAHETARQRKLSCCTIQCALAVVCALLIVVFPALFGVFSCSASGDSSCWAQLLPAMISITAVFCLISCFFVALQRVASKATQQRAAAANSPELEYDQCLDQLRILHMHQTPLENRFLNMNLLRRVRVSVSK